MAPTIVLVHGLWLTPRSWEGWKARFEERGHKVLAPAWPRMEGEVEGLRRDTDELPRHSSSPSLPICLSRPPGNIVELGNHRRCGHLTRPACRRSRRPA